MPRRNWRERSALKLIASVVGVLLAAAVFVAVVTYGRGKQVEYNREAYERHREYSRNTYYPARDACIRLPFVNQAHCVAEATHRARENERQEQDLVAQRVTALWTFLMGCAAVVGMCLSAVGVGLVWTTFRETREANSIARKEAAASEADRNPFLLLEIVDWRLSVNMPRVDGDVNPVKDHVHIFPDPKVTYHFTNFGKTPAIIQAIQGELRVESKVPHSKDIWFDIELPMGRTVDSYNHTKRSETAPIRLSDDDIRSIQNGETFLWFFGYVTFDDLVGNQYVTEFCWVADDKFRGMKRYDEGRSRNYCKRIKTVERPPELGAFAT